MKTVVANKRANFDYIFSKKIDAGIVLTGSEVKSLRINTGSLQGSFIVERNGELWLSKCHIKKYNNSSNTNYDPIRDKKLLVSKKEINKILGSIKQESMSMIPISLYFNKKGLAKLCFGIGRGKKKFDKRQTIKEKDWNIKKERLLKNN